MKRMTRTLSLHTTIEHKSWLEHKSTKKNGKKVSNLRVCIIVLTLWVYWWWEEQKTSKERWEQQQENRCRRLHVAALKHFKHVKSCVCDFCWRMVCHSGVDQSTLQRLHTLSWLLGGTRMRKPSHFASAQRYPTYYFLNRERCVPVCLYSFRCEKWNYTYSISNYNRKLFTCACLERRSIFITFSWCSRATKFEYYPFSLNFQTGLRWCVWWK